MSTEMLAAARTAALFCCDLSATDQLTRADATAAIRTAVRARHGTRGCACDVAQEFGDHPDTAQARMLWARKTVADLFGRSDEIVWSSPAVKL